MSFTKSLSSVRPGPLVCTTGAREEQAPLLLVTAEPVNTRTLWAHSGHTKSQGCFGGSHNTDDRECFRDVETQRQTQGTLGDVTQSPCPQGLLGLRPQGLSQPQSPSRQAGACTPRLGD